MNLQKTVDDLIQSQLYDQSDRPKLLTDIAHIKSTSDLFNYILSQIGDKIEDWIDFVKQQGLRQEIRKLFKPEIQFWLLKIKIAEAFGADTNDQDVLETIDESLRSEKHQSRRQMISQLYETMIGEKIPENDSIQICEKLQHSNYLFEELNEQINRQELQEQLKKISEDEIEQIGRRIKEAKLSNLKEYYEQLREDIKGVPENVIDYKLKAAEIELGEMYLYQEGLVQPKITEPIKQLIESLNLTDSEAKKARVNIQNEKDIRRNLKILRKAVCGIDIFDMLRMIKKGHEEQETMFRKIKIAKKKTRVILFFGLSKAGKTTLITKLMGYPMKKIQINGIPTIQPSNPDQIQKQHKQLKIGYSNRSTTRYPKLYKVPSHCLPEKDREKYDTFCMDSAGLEDTAGIEVEGSNRITMIQLLKKIDKLQIVIVIKNWEDNGKNIEKIAKTTSSIIRDYSKIEKSIKFVFNSTDQEFLKSVHAQVVDLYQNINSEIQTRNVIDENYWQFFISLKKQTEKLEQMQAIDILNLDIKGFYDKLFQAQFIQNPHFCFITDIGGHCKREIRKVVERCRKSFYQEYKKGNTKQAQYFIDFMGKIGSEQKFESETHSLIDEMKDDIKECLQEQIKNFITDLQNLQISHIKDKQSREKRFDKTQADYQYLKARIEKYKELQKSSEFDQRLKESIDEVRKDYQAKTDKWKEKQVNLLRDKIDCTIHAREFLRRFLPKKVDNYEQKLFKLEQDFHETILQQIEKANQNNQINLHFKLLCAIQEAQGKEINYKQYQQLICKKFTTLKNKVTLINLDESGENEPERVVTGIDEEKEIEKTEKLLKFLKIIDIYPSELVVDRQHYKKVYEKIVIKVPAQYKRRLWNTIQKIEEDEDSLEQQNLKNSVEEIKVLIKHLNILSKINTIKNYYEDTLIDRQKNLQEIIDKSIKQFERIAIAFNSNKVSQVRSNVNTMRSQLRRLENLVKIIPETGLYQRFKMMKNNLAESIKNFMDANDINETFNFKNIQSLEKALEKYAKLKEFQEIHKIIESENLAGQMRTMIRKIEEKILSPLNSLKKEMEQTKKFYPNKLDNYLSYIDILEKNGDNILKPKFKGELQETQSQIKNSVGKLYQNVIMDPLNELRQLLTENMKLQKDNIATILKKVSLNQTQKYRKPFQIFTDLMDKYKLVKEEFFDDLDYQWQVHLDTFRTFKYTVQSKVESQGEINTLDDLKRISNIMKYIEVPIGNETKIFEQLVDKISLKMKQKGDEEKQTLETLLKADHGATGFDAEKFKNIYSQIIDNETDLGKKNRRKMEEYFEEYKNDVQKKLEKLKVEMLDLDDGYGKKILEVFQIINSYNRNLQIIAAKAAENSPFNNSQYELADMQRIMNYFEEKLLEYNSDIKEDFMYKTEAQMRKESRNLQAIESEIKELLRKYKLPKYEKQLGEKNYLSEGLKKIKQERKKKLESFEVGENVVEKIDGEMIKFMKGLNQEEKQKIQNRIVVGMEKSISELVNAYKKDYEMYEKERENIQKRFKYFSNEIQEMLVQKYNAVQEKLEQENNYDFTEIQKKELQSSIDDFLSLGRKFKSSNNIANIQKLEQCIRNKSSQINYEQSFQFLNQLWPRKDKLQSQAQSQQIRNSFIRIESELLKYNEKKMQGNINQIQKNYKNIGIDNSFHDFMSESSSSNRNKRLLEIVDCLNNLQSEIERERILAEVNKEMVNKLLDRLNKFLNELIDGGEANINTFKLIKDDILGNQDKIEITFLKIKNYERDFKTLSLRKEFKKADKIKIQLKRLRKLKEDLYSYVNEIIIRPFDFYSVEVRENGQDQDSKRIEEFEMNLQKLNILMNCYNSCLSPPQEIKMQQIKKRIQESCGNVPQQYKNCLEENTKDTKDEHNFDKRLAYIPKLLKIIRSKPRKYFIKSDFYLEECLKILKTSISQKEKQLDEAIRNVNTNHLNKNKEYEEYKKTEEQNLKAQLLEQQKLKNKELQKIDQDYEAELNNEKKNEEKEKIQKEWDSRKNEAETTSKKNKENLEEAYQKQLEKKRRQNNQKSKQLTEEVVKKLVTVKKLSGITLVNQQLEEKIDQKLRGIKKSEIKQIFTILQKSGNPVATRIFDENQLFKKLKAKKFSQETKDTNSAEYILKNMLNSRSITKDQYQDFLWIYGKFKEEQDKYIKDFEQLKDKSIIDQLQMRIKREGQQFKMLHSKEGEVIRSKRRVQLLAKIFALWSISSSVEEIQNQQEDYTVFYRAHAAQILCVIMILCMDDVDISNKLITFNRLAEIKTGEGKSIVLAILSIFFALFGYKVHCACYSEMLSRRDKEQFAKLFTLCGVKDKIHYGVFQTIIKKVLNQNDQKMNQDESFEEVIKQIINKQPSTQSMSRLSSIYTWGEEKLVSFMKKFNNYFNLNINNSDKSKQILLIDEIDVLFNKDYYGDTFNQSIDLRDPSIVQLFKFIWANKAQLDYNLIQRSPEFKQVIEKFKPLTQVLKNQINGMLAGLTTYKDQIYVVKDKKIMYKVEDSLKEVSYRYNTVYAYFEEFQKHKVSESAFNDNLTINLCVAQFSYACLPEYYHGVLGVTGTLTCLPEYIKEHLERYRINRSQLFPIPSVYINNSENQLILSPMCIDWKELFETIVDNINENFEKQRPILVFFRNKHEMLEFYNCSEFKRFREFTSYITQEHNYSERLQRIKNSSFKKTITLMTHSFIRGVDFKLYNKKAIEAGGFHAIVAYLIDSPADYIQATGRIGRQGRKGSFIEIYKKEDLEILDIDIEQPNPTLLVKQRRLLKQEKEKDLCEQKLKNSKIKHDETIKVFLDNNFSQSSLINYVANKNKFPKFLKANKVRFIMMIDATISMESLFQQLKIILPQIFDDTYLTLKEKKFPGCLEMQIVLYRNYNSNIDQILEVSTFDNQGDALKSFISQSQVSGGCQNEAIEVALQYVNTIKNIRQIILIGDIGGNTPSQVKTKRQLFDNLEKERIQKGMVPTTTEDQVNELIKKNVKISGLYLKNILTTKKYFESVSKQTSGTAKYIDIYDKGSSKAIAEFIVERALMSIGCEKGDELIQTYRQILQKRMEK